MILIEIGNRQPQTGTQPLFFISYPPQYDGSHLPQRNMLCIPQGKRGRQDVVDLFVSVFPDERQKIYIRLRRKESLGLVRQAISWLIADG